MSESVHAPPPNLTRKFPLTDMLTEGDNDPRLRAHRAPAVCRLDDLDKPCMGCRKSASARSSRLKECPKKRRKGVRILHRCDYQGKCIVGVPVSTLVKARTRASGDTRAQVKPVEQAGPPVSRPAFVPQTTSPRHGAGRGLSPPAAAHRSTRGSRRSPDRDRRWRATVS
jgi:hypothetical protein